VIRTFLTLAFSASSVLSMMPLPAGAQTGSSPSEAARKFRVYLDEDWKRWMNDYPVMATFVGYHGQNRRWSDDSPEGIEGRIKHLHESLATLKTISREALPVSEQLNYDLYRGLLETAEEGLQYGNDPSPFASVVPGNLWMSMDQMGGIQQGAASVFASMPQQNVADYEDILARFETLPKVIEQSQALMQLGLKKGYTPPKLMLRDVPRQIAGLIPADPMASPLLAPFTKFPAGFPETQRIRLTNRAKQIYTGSVAPAFQKLHDYVVSTYLPACRESIAVSALPNGAAAYAFLIHWQTTTNLTAQQIHEIGLTEVKRIRAEMDKVIASTGFKGSFHDFIEFLRSDSQFFYDKPDDLENGYRVVAKKIDPELARLFGKLPRLPYGVCVIPDFKAPSQTTAYYEPGAPAAGRAGCYFVNTYNLRARPKWKWKRSPSTRRCQGIICRFRWHKNWRMCRNFGSISGIRRLMKAGRCTRRASAKKSDCTRIRTRNSASSVTRCGAPCGSWWTRECTRWDGRGSKPSISSARIPARRIKTSPSKWIATSCGPDKPWPTRSGK